MWSMCNVPSLTRDQRIEQFCVAARGCRRPHAVSTTRPTRRPGTIRVLTAAFEDAWQSLTTGGADPEPQWLAAMPPPRVGVAHPAPPEGPRPGAAVGGRPWPFLGLLPGIQATAGRAPCGTRGRRACS